MESETPLPISYLSSSVTELKKLFDNLFTTFSLMQRLTNRKYEAVFKILLDFLAALEI